LKTYTDKIKFGLYWLTVSWSLLNDYRMGDKHMKTLEVMTYPF